MAHITTRGQQGEAGFGTGPARNVVKLPLGVWNAVTTHRSRSTVNLGDVVLAHFEKPTLIGSGHWIYGNLLYVTSDDEFV